MVNAKSCQKDQIELRKNKAAKTLEQLTNITIIPKVDILGKKKPWDKQARNRWKKKLGPKSNYSVISTWAALKIEIIAKISNVSAITKLQKSL